jgi:hypothetical protein
MTDSNINSFESGLHSDYSHNRQPKGTYRFALNTISETTEGDLGYRSNELSNEAVAAMPAGYRVIGHIYIGNEEDVVFGVNGANSLIGKLDKNSKFSTLIESDCLSFNHCNEIEGVYRIKNGCDKIIYFVDHLNPDRAINISDLDSYIRTDYIDGVDDPLSKWNCSEFNIDRIDNTLSTKFIKYTEGGDLPAGTVQLVLRHLDSNKNGAGYTIATETIPVIDDNYSSPYNDIDGTIALNTNKAVEFEINGIDNNYDFLEITAIVTTAGVTSAYIVEELNIVDSLINYTLVSVSGGTPIDVSSINKTKDIFSSKTITQLENRLIRANIKCSSKDYSQLQSYANNITSHYEVYQQDATDVNDSAVKTGDYYWYGKSYMRDEVYAFGIVYLFDDNTISPVTHIPGRAKNSFSFVNQGAHRPTVTTSWDDQEYTLLNTGWNQTTSIPAVEGTHLGLSDGSKVARWKVYNTAYKNTTLNPDVHSAGEMAYYETNTNYPNTLDCNGVPIYGNLAGTPIRHHKFPDSSLEPHSEGTDKINPLGIKFKNITLPPNAYAYRIVRCNRDDNKTVLDKGLTLFNRGSELDGVDINFQPYLGNLSFFYDTATNGVETHSIPDGPEAGFTVPDGDVPPLQGISGNSLSFHSPLSKFIKPVLKGNYIKTENTFNAPGDTIDFEGPAGTGITTDYILDSVEVDNTTNCYINTTIDAAAYVDFNSVLQSGILSKKFINNYAEEAFVLELENDTNCFDGNTDVLSHTEISITVNSSVGDGGDLVTASQAVYHSIKSSEDVYKDLSKLTYYTASRDWEVNSSTLVFGGDTFIPKFSFVQSATVKALGDIWANSVHPFSGSPRDFQHNYSNIITFFTESEINSELRHELPGEIYFPKTGDVTTHLNCTADDGTTYRPNYYHYNNDFNKANTINAFIALPNSYRYCSDCDCSFPNRVLYSEQSFQEEITDNYLAFKTNNYRDTMPNKGNITKIYNFKNQLFLDCEESRFYLPSTTQAIQASGQQVYIGTGEFFSVPVKEVVDANVGYMGNQSQRAFTITEHGVFSVDSKDGKVFLFGGGGKQSPVISDIGYRNWFEENLPVNLAIDYEDVLGEEFPCIDNPASNVGFTAGYDTRYDRWLLTKQDYKLSEGAKIALDPNTPTIVSLLFENGNWILDIFNVSREIIQPEDIPEYFENCSWTISYSVKDRSWTSLHSYLPNHYIDSKTKLYSTIKEDNNFWKHHKRFEYQTFYGKFYPHIIELVSNKNPMETSIFNTVKFHTQAKQWDSVNKYFIDKRLITFDKANLYNSYQSSGDIELLTKREQNHFGRDQERWHQQALLDVNEKEYSFNEFRDLVEDRNQALFTKNWNLSEYRSNYYIDKVLNPTSINLNKNWWEQEVFRDKYLVIRLFFTTFVNTKLVTNFNVTDKNYTEK